MASLYALVKFRDSNLDLREEFARESWITDNGKSVLWPAIDATKTCRDLMMKNALPKVDFAYIKFPLESSAIYSANLPMLEDTLLLMRHEIRAERRADASSLDDVEKPANDIDMNPSSQLNGLIVEMKKTIKTLEARVSQQSETLEIHEGYIILDHLPLKNMADFVRINDLLEFNLCLVTLLESKFQSVQSATFRDKITGCLDLVFGDYYFVDQLSFWGDEAKGKTALGTSLVYEVLASTMCGNDRVALKEAKRIAQEWIDNNEESDDDYDNNGEKQTQDPVQANHRQRWGESSSQAAARPDDGGKANRSHHRQASSSRASSAVAKKKRAT